MSVQAKKNRGVFHATQIDRRKSLSSKNLLIL